MDEQIVKLSDMERAETLRGFYALGVNDNNRSVVADLGAVEDAAESANEAAESANEAAEGAEKVNVTMEGTMLSVTDREGNTTTTDVKGKDGKAGGINIPRFYIEEGEDGRKHLYCEVPEAGDIRVYTKEVEGRKHLILEF